MLCFMYFLSYSVLQRKQTYKTVCTKPWFKPMVLCMQTHVHKTMVFSYKHGENYKSLLLGLCKGGSYVLNQDINKIKSLPIYLKLSLSLSLFVSHPMHTSIFDNKERHDDKLKRWIPYKRKSLDSVVSFDDPQARKSHHLLHNH